MAYNTLDKGDTVIVSSEDPENWKIANYWHGKYLHEFDRLSGLFTETRNRDYFYSDEYNDRRNDYANRKLYEETGIKVLDGIHFPSLNHRFFYYFMSNRDKFLLTKMSYVDE